MFLSQERGSSTSWMGREKEVQFDLKGVKLNLDISMLALIPV